MLVAKGVGAKGRVKGEEEGGTPVGGGGVLTSRMGPLQ